ncbi:hypothetical protein ACWD4V_18465 [Streptomyces tsukubensis]
MAKGSATAAGPPATGAWHRLAEPTPQRSALWSRGRDSTRWAACGRAWDAIAIRPMTNGLNALAVMELDPHDGHPVLADRLSNVLYVLVPPGTGTVAAGLPGVRVLGVGHQLLMPMTDHGTAAAHWISPPRKAHPPLAPAGRLTACLRALLAADHKEAAAS